MWQRTDLAQVKRDRHTGKPRKARSTKTFRLRQSTLSAEMRRKRPSLPTGEVRPSEHNYDYAAEKYTSLVSGGMTPLDAHFTVSRLLGHERPDVTDIYLVSVKGGSARGE